MTNILTENYRDDSELEQSPGGMAEWFKAAVLKTVVRKYRGFESYFLRHIALIGEVTELADGARLLSECGGYTPPRVRIPLSPPSFFVPLP